MTTERTNAISQAQALELLASYAESGAVWWMEPRMDLLNRHLKTELVVSRPGQELMRRTLMSAAYPGLIRCLNQQAERPLPLPHAPDMEYENEALLAPLRKEARQLCKRLTFWLNKLLRRQYLLEDAGLSTPAAQSWHSYAVELEKEAGWEKLRRVSKNAGTPSYLYHSSQLVPLVQSAAAAYDKIQALLAAPYPGPAQPDKRNGTPTQKRRWYPRYVDHDIYIGWDPDNMPSLDDVATAPLPPLAGSDDRDMFPPSRDDIREELVEIRDQINRLLARL